MKHVLLKRRSTPPWLEEDEASTKPEWIVVPTSKRQGFNHSCWKVVDVGSKNSMRKLMSEELRLYFVNRVMRE